jgi:TRAP-type C4-dicarboxylate transport system permease small subunit
MPMREAVLTAGKWLHRRAENLLAIMLGVMFFAFITQIIFRYLLGLPTGWTHELSAMLWVWLVLFGSAFVISEEQEIRFDIVYGMTRGRVRRTVTIITGTFLLGTFIYSLPAMWDYVTFMKVEKTAYLDVRFDYLYSIYIAFAVAMIVRYLYLTWEAAFGPDSDEAPHVGPDDAAR